MNVAIVEINKVTISHCYYLILSPPPISSALQYSYHLYHYSNYWRPLPTLDSALVLLVATAASVELLESVVLVKLFSSAAVTSPACVSVSGAVLLTEALEGGFAASSFVCGEKTKTQDLVVRNLRLTAHFHAN